MRMVIADYGVGNIYSLKKAMEHIGVEIAVSKDVKILNDCTGIILPGVGAYRDACVNMSESGLDEIIKGQAAKGKLIMGICLGMQLLFDYSTEGGLFKGLGLLDGWIDRLSGSMKIPHMGWNTLQMKNKCRLLEDIEEGAHVYYVHSYFARVMNANNICAVSSYGIDIPTVVQKDNIVGFQFHPEKSGEVGLSILKNIKEMLI